MTVQKLIDLLEKLPEKDWHINVIDYNIKSTQYVFPIRGIEVDQLGTLAPTVRIII